MEGNYTRVCIAGGYKLMGNLNEEEIGKFPEKEFRIMTVKMIKHLGKKWRKCKNQLTKT